MYMEMYMECTIMYILLIYNRTDVHSCDIHSGQVHIWMGW